MSAWFIATPGSTSTFAANRFCTCARQRANAPSCAKPANPDLANLASLPVRWYVSVATSFDQYASRAAACGSR